MHRSSIIALLVGAAALGACQQQPEQSPDSNAAREPVLNLPAVARPQPPIDRASLLVAVAEAASATAAGSEMPASVQSLDGRQFELRIRFGCSGPTDELRGRWLGWSFDAQDRRVRVRAMPTISKEDALVTATGGGEYEAVEGFWIPRPWLLLPVCPATAAVSSAAPSTDPEPGEEPRQRPAGGRTATEAAAAQEAESLTRAPRIGIAQFFTDQDARTRRRGMRPYESSYTLPEGQAISSQGYNLVLSGRLRSHPQRPVIQCSARDADSPPECVISAEFLRVWIEKPDSREILAEWGTG